MLRAVCTDRSDTLGLGVSFLHPSPVVENVWYPPGDWSHNFRPGFLADGLLRDLIIDLPLGTYAAADVVGYDSDLPPIFVDLGVRKPVCERGYDPSQDWLRYGSIIGGLLRVLRQAPPSGTNWSRESRLDDVTARGIVVSGSSRQRIFSMKTIRPHYGTNLITYSDEETPCYHRMEVRLSDDPLEDPVSVMEPGTYALGWGLDRVDLPLLFGFLQKGCVLQATIDAGPANNFLTWSNFSLDISMSPTETVVCVGYQFLNRASQLADLNGGPPIKSSLAVYDVSLRFRLVPQLPYKHYSAKPVGVFPVGVTAGAAAVKQYTLKSFWTDYELPGNYPWLVQSADDDLSDAEFSPVHVLERPGSYDGEPTAFWTKPASASQKYGVDRPTYAFKHFVDSIHDDIRVACALSANDCLSRFKANFNSLESVPELPGMLKSITDVKKIGKVFSLFTSGSPLAWLGLIDLLAEGYLLYKYGVKPLVSDVEEAREIATRYANQIDFWSKGLPRRLNGVFKYEIPDAVPGIPGTVVVDVRTTMALRSSPAGVLAYIFAMDEVGLLPTLSRLWDLVPFSFVVDWFTGLSARFEDIDASAKRFALELDYYVHTWTYKLYPDSKFLAPYAPKLGYKPMPHFRVFKREISCFHPILRQTKYDFHPSKGLKNHLLAGGSLLWVAH